MKNIKKTPLIDLLDRIDYIDKKVESLMIERDKIVFELWDRFPNSKEEDEFQPKVLRRVKKNGRQ